MEIEDFERELTGVKNQPSKMDKAKAFGAGAVQGASLGWADEVYNRIGAAYASGMMDDLTYAEALKEAQSLTEERLGKMRDESGGFFTGGEIAGGIASGLALPASRALKSGSLLSRSLETAKYAVPAAAAYGAGSAPEGDKIMGGAMGALAATVAAPVMVAGGEAARRVVRSPLGDKVKQMLTPAPRQVDALSGAVQRFTEKGSDAAKMAGRGKILPLTQAEATQNPSLQRLQDMARKGSMGPEAQDILLASEADRSKMAEKAITSMASGKPLETPTKEVTSLYAMGKKAFYEAKKDIGKKYKIAEEVGKNVRIPEHEISGIFLGAVNKRLAETGYDPRNPKYRPVEFLLEKSKEYFKGIPNLNTIEKYRKLVNQTASENPEMSGVIKNIRDALDNNIDDIISKREGQTPALAAFKDARAANRHLEGILENDDMVSYLMKETTVGKALGKKESVTREMIRDYVLGKGERAATTGKKSDIGRFADTIMRMTPEAKRGEMQNKIRRAVISNVLKQARGELSANQPDAVFNLSPQKALSAVNAILDNETLVKKVFLDKRKMLVDLQDDLTKMVSKQPGAVNMSGSGDRVISTLFDIAKSAVPGGATAAQVGKNIMHADASKAEKDAFLRNMLGVYGQRQLGLEGGTLQKTLGIAAGEQVGGMSARRDQ